MRYAAQRCCRASRKAAAVPATSEFLLNATAVLRRVQDVQMARHRGVERGECVRH